MSQDAARQRLLQFLDEHVFDPVLRFPPDRVDRREEFEDAQARIERTRQSCHACRSADELRSLCLEALESPSSCKADRELDRVGLPTLSRLNGRFLALCDELGVGAGEPLRGWGQLRALR